MTGRISIPELRARKEWHEPPSEDVMLALLDAVEAAHLMRERLIDDGPTGWSVAPAAREWRQLGDALARFDFGDPA